MSQTRSTRDLKKNIVEALRTRGDNPPTKLNTKRAVEARDQCVAEWPDFDQRRDHASQSRQQAVDDLPRLHDQLRAKWSANGIVVHEAQTAEIARREVLSIVQKAGANCVMKSKSMLSEEIEVNAFLESEGIEAVETDLGEYIVQLRHEAPSHITMPAMHLNRKDIGRLFEEKLGEAYSENPPELTAMARRALRSKFLSTEVGIVGVNFAVAETGHIATVTNEGNGRMVTTMPRVVIALMGWERVTQDLAELGRLWQLLARSATGQRATVYLNLMQKPDPEGGGPEEIHVIVVDNGRTAIYDDEQLRSTLRCIRCGACLNVCPVYQQVGGHPYGGVYPGPIGSVLAPQLLGIFEAPDHPFASSLCGACEEVCPVGIPLPQHLLTLRERRVATRGVIDLERPVWRAFRTVMGSQQLYETASSIGRGVQAVWPGGAEAMKIPGWTDHRDAPAFAKTPFRTWAKKNLGGGDGES